MTDFMTLRREIEEARSQTTRHPHASNCSSHHPDRFDRGIGLTVA
jgi:hypothetical protein